MCVEQKCEIAVIKLYGGNSVEHIVRGSMRFAEIIESVGMWGTCFI